MPGRSRRVSFAAARDEGEGDTRRTRGRPSQTRARSRSAERVHRIADSFNAMPGRERVVGREAYDQLQRENHILRIEKRELDNEVAQLRAYTQQLEHENDVLRGAAGNGSAVSADTDASARAEARKAKLKEARKQNAQLAMDVKNLADQVFMWRRLNDEADLRLETMRDKLNLHLEERAALEHELASLRRGAARGY
ncbi:hypothetical protein BT67DRAFT_435013 [Trichocladium antarcticum]|uniref:Uncharacterized protein n=1 Tax=Trichocladium antarcticum TaxID=1450529 RepID=A0AAN6ZCD9_9PEZI|nr:hypothetical protein BT67DRAFT_435013 [Trichocladium antarcticum]